MQRLIELTALCLGIGFLSPFTAGVNSHGSLAIFVPTVSGLVVCTDKREWNDVRGPSDNEIKTFVVNQNAAFAVTGAVAILDRLTLRPVFSVKDVVMEHLKDGTGVPFEDRVRTLSGALSEAYARFKLTDSGRLQQSLGSADDVVYSVTVWYVGQSRINVGQIQLHKSASGEPESVSYHDVTEQFNRSFSLEGQTEFVLAAVRNSDSRFQSFKFDPDIMSVWTSTDPTLVTQELAVRFGRKVILNTNQFHSLVSQTPTMVSAAADCSLMNPMNGFKWLK